MALRTLSRKGNSQKGRETREKMREKHPDIVPTTCPGTEHPGGGRSFLTDEQVHFERLFTVVGSICWSKSYITGLVSGLDSIGLFPSVKA